MMKKLFISLMAISCISLPSFSATYTTNLGLKKPAHGEDVNTWDTTINSNMDIIDSSVAIIPVNLGSQVTGILPSANMVSTTVFTSKQNVFTDENNFQTITGTSVSITGPLNISSLVANQCVQTGAGGLLTTSGAACGGSGSSSSMAVNQNGVQITSPTIAINALSPPFIVSSVGGGTTAQWALDGSSVTLKGNNVIFLQNTLQNGATFYVSSGTISGQLSSNKVITSTLSVLGDATIDSARVTGTNGLTIDSLTSGQCVQTTTGGKLSVTGAPCGTATGQGAIVPSTFTWGLVDLSTFTASSATITNGSVKYLLAGGPTGSNGYRGIGSNAAIVTSIDPVLLVGTEGAISGNIINNNVIGSTSAAISGYISSSPGTMDTGMAIYGSVTGTLANNAYGLYSGAVATAPNNYGVFTTARGGTNNYGLWVDSGSVRIPVTNSVLATDSNGIIISTTVSSGSSSGVSVYPATATASFPFGLSASSGVFSDGTVAIATPLTVSNPATAGPYSAGIRFMVSGDQKSRIIQYGYSNAAPQTYSVPMVFEVGGTSVVYVNSNNTVAVGGPSILSTMTVVGNSSIGSTPATPPTDGLYVQGSIKNAALSASLGVCTDGSKQLTTSGCSFGGGGSGNGTVNAASQFSLPYYSLAGSSNVLSAFPGVTASTNTGVSISTLTVSSMTFSGTGNLSFNNGSGSYQFVGSSASATIGHLAIFSSSWSIVDGGVIPTSGSGGGLSLQPSTTTINISSGLILSGSAGSSGQLLKSNGPGTVPSWVTASGTGDAVLAGTQTWTGENTFIGNTTFFGEVTIVGKSTVTYENTLVQVSTLSLVRQIRWADGTIQVSSPAAGGTGTGTKAPISYALDGGGVVISSAANSLQSFYEMPYAATISSYTLSCDSLTSTISVSVSSQTAANFTAGSTPTSICASACPSLSSQRRKGDGVLTGWTTSLSAGDYVVFDLKGSAPTAATRCLLQLLLQ